MFKISAIQSFEEQTAVAEACGVSAREGFFAYVMREYENGELMGFSQFEICADEGLIVNLSPAPGTDDFEAMFILGRTTMNFIDLCGAHKCRAEFGAAEERLLTAIGFRKSKCGYFVNMEGMFDGSHCSGDAVKL